jgi:tetratricopeptide (TPR) repeat protein
LEEGDYGEAIQKYTEAIAIEPSSVLLYTNRALAHMRLSEWERASEDARKAIQLNPNLLKAHYRVILSLIQSKLFDEARVALNTALKLFPMHKDIIYLQKRWIILSTLYRESSTVTPNSPNFKIYLAAITAQSFVKALSEDKFPAESVEAFFGVSMPGQDGGVSMPGQDGGVSMPGQDGGSFDEYDWPREPIGDLLYSCWSNMDRIQATYGDKDTLTFEYALAMLQGRMPTYFKDRVLKTAREFEAAHGAPNNYFTELIRRNFEGIVWSPVLTQLKNPDF